MLWTFLNTQYNAVDAPFVSVSVAKLIKIPSEFSMGGHITFLSLPVRFFLLGTQIFRH